MGIIEDKYFIGAKISCLALQHPEKYSRERYVCLGTRDSSNHFLVFCKINHDGTFNEVFKSEHDININRIVFVEPQILVMSDELGTLNTLKIDEEFHYHSGFNAVPKNIYNERINKMDWNKQFMFLSAGIRGNVYLSDISQQKLLRIYNNASSSCIWTINCFPSFNGFLIGNNVGQVKLFDSNIGSNSCVKTFQLKNDMCSVSAVAFNPFDEKNFLIGHSDGSIRVWDTRKEDMPVSRLNVHKAQVNQILFDPKSEIVYSCCSAGKIVAINPIKEKSKVGNIWSRISAYEHEIKIDELVENEILSINSMEIFGNEIIAGGDSNYIIHVKII